MNSFCLFEYCKAPAPKVQGLFDEVHRNQATVYLILILMCTSLITS